MLVKNEFEQYNIDELKQTFPHVSFKIQEDNRNILALYRGTWVGVQNDHILKILKNYNTFKEKNADNDFLSQYKDYFLIVLSDGNMYVSRSKSQCVGLKGDDQYAFIGLLGYDPDDESMNTVLATSTALTLRNAHKPDDFDNLSARKITTQHEEASISYIASTRRWATISIELEDERWRREFFLLDTGAPNSYIWRPLAKYLKGKRTDTKTIPPKLDTIACQIEGEIIELNVTDSDWPDSRLHGINILGTDFLNEFVLIDDFLGQKCQLLKPYKKEIYVKIEKTSNNK